MAVKGSGECPRCGTADQLLYNLEPTDKSLGLACPECCRFRAKSVHRSTPCDTCGAPGAWRNPNTRRNEFLCGTHHAESPEGVFQNLWAPRASKPLSSTPRAVCDVKSSDCRGEVKPRTLTLPSGTKKSTLLCTKHAGKTSAVWAVEDKEV